jgi:hypothetical protein
MCTLHALCGLLVMTHSGAFQEGEKSTRWTRPGRPKMAQFGGIMKLVVCPGLPRSGTTYLFKELCELNTDIFNSPKTKEIHVFFQSSDPEAIRQHFHENSEDKFYLDASPGYLISKKPAIENILKCAAQEKKIILCLRHPVDQLFAHYLHDLKAHYSKRQFGDDVSRPLFAQTTLGRYMSMRADAIERLVSGVGRDNVCVINFHKDLPDMLALTSKLSQFLGHRLAKFPDRVVSPGGWIPHYLYGGSEGVEVAIEDSIHLVPPQGLLLINNNESMFWPCIGEDVARRLVVGASTWTREVREEHFTVLEEAFRDDWQRILDVLDLDADDFKVTRHLVARPSFPSKQIARELPRVANVAGNVERCRFVAGVG